MATISQNLASILAAQYGSQVRGAIHDSISQCYTDVSTAKVFVDSATTNANTAAGVANTAALNA